MGAVYRARDDEGGDVALKLLTNPGQAARFDIEARLLAPAHHPRVVEVIDHLEDDGRKWLVMELVAGTDLARVLEERGSPGPAARRGAGVRRARRPRRWSTCTRSRWCTAT